MYFSSLCILYVCPTNLIFLDLSTTVILDERYKLSVVSYTEINQHERIRMRFCSTGFIENRMRNEGIKTELGRIRNEAIKIELGISY
jgi:hypothetical protein